MATTLKRGVLFTAPDNQTQKTKVITKNIKSSTVTIKKDPKNQNNVKVTITVSISNARIVTNFDPLQTRDDQVLVSLEPRSVLKLNDKTALQFGRASNGENGTDDVAFDVGGKTGGGKVGGPGF